MLSAKLCPLFSGPGPAFVSYFALIGCRSGAPFSWASQYEISSFSVGSFSQTPLIVSGTGRKAIIPPEPARCEFAAVSCRIRRADFVSPSVRDPQAFSEVIFSHPS